MCGWRKSSTGWPRHLPEADVFKALRQLFHHSLAFRIAHRKPGADLLQGAPASLAQARTRVIGANLYAGTFHLFVYAVFALTRKSDLSEPDCFKMGNRLN